MMIRHRKDFEVRDSSFFFFFCLAVGSQLKEKNNVEVATEPLTCNVLIGNRAWMQQNGLEVTDDMEESMQEHEEKGHTAVLVGINGEPRP